MDPTNSNDVNDYLDTAQRAASVATTKNTNSSTPQKSYDTQLSPDDETKFQAWKQQNAPNDSGADYDLRGAYKSGLSKDIASGHWPDTYKKPNHPTFSDQSIYAKDAPDKAGHWAGANGDQYVPAHSDPDAQEYLAAAQKAASASSGSNAQTSPQNNTDTSTPQAPIGPGALDRTRALLNEPYQQGNKPGFEGIFGPSFKSQGPTPDETAQQNTEAITQTNQALGKSVGQPEVNYQDNQLTGNEKAKINLGGTDVTKQSAFKKMYPNGDMQPVKEPGETANTLLFRRTPDEPYARLNPSDQERWKIWFNSIDNKQPQDQRNHLFVMALADTMENNPRESAVTGISTLLTGGAGLLRSLVMLPATSALTTTIIDEAGRANKIDPGQDRTDTAMQGVKQGFNAWVGMLVGQSMVAAKNALAGGGLMKVGENAKAALAAVENLKQYVKDNNLGDEVSKYLGLMPQQVIELPILRRLANKTAALLPQIPEFIKGQKSAAFVIAKNTVDEDALKGGLQTSGEILPQKTGSMPQAVEDYKDFVTTQHGPSNPRTSTFDAGKALSSDLADYESRSQDTVDKLYEHARSIEEPRFDPTPAIKAADEVSTGTQTLSKYEKTPIYGAETDAQGNPVQSYSAVNKETTAIASPQPALQKIIDKINLWRDNPPIPVAVKQADGTITTQSTMDQINALRKQAWELSRTGPAGETRGDEALAGKVYGGLTKMIDQTRNNNPDFQQAWQTASKAASDRFSNLENPLVRRGYKQDETGMVTTPESSIKTLTGDAGRQVSNLDYLKGVVKPETYQGIIDSKKTSILDDPNKITDTLSKLDPELKKRLFSDPKEYDQYKNLGTIFDNLNSSGIQEAIKKQNNMAQFVDDMVQRGQKETESFRQLRSLVQIYPNSESAQATRAGIIDKLIHDAWTSDKGLDQLKGDYFNNWLHEAGRKDMLQFLTPQDVQHLKDLNSFMQFTQGGKNMADSFAAAGEASKVSKLEHEAIILLAEHAGLGKLFTSPMVQKFLYGTGGAHSKGTMLKTIAQAFTGYNTAPPTSPGSPQP